MPNFSVGPDREEMAAMTDEEVIDLLISESMTGHEMDNRTAIAIIRAEVIRRLERKKYPGKKT